jgi:hypothetical protein
MGRSKQWIDERAQRDVNNGKHDPPKGWLPGPEPVGTPDRDAYDRAWDYHNDRKNSDN